MQAHSGKRPNTRVPDRTRGRIAVKYRPIGDLNLALKNTRAHSPGQILQVDRGVDTFGFPIPLSVDCNSNMIAVMAVSWLASF
jgi:hypothetical protein